MYRSFGKRLLDLLFSCMLLLVLGPVFLIVMLILFMANNGYPFFFQERPGYKERPIRIIKFKSMNDKKDKDGNLLPDVERLTWFGGLVRKLSLDELPQLINVIKGDMSLIGPRPLLYKYIPLYSAEQRKRHDVKPGITGWAQINGRNAISWSRKFELDVYYVNHLSFRLDVKIFFMTIAKIVKSEGVNQSEARPMEPFKGNN